MTDASWLRRCLGHIVVSGSYLLIDILEQIQLKIFKATEYISYLGEIMALQKKSTVFGLGQESMFHLSQCTLREWKTGR